MTWTLPPDHPLAPKYWVYEQGDALRPAMLKLIDGKTLTEGDVAVIRDYFVQWVCSPVWDDNPHMNAAGRQQLQMLREEARQILTGTDIRRWLIKSAQQGVDPV